MPRKQLGASGCMLREEPAFTDGRKRTGYTATETKSSVDVRGKGPTFTGGRKGDNHTVQKQQIAINAHASDRFFLEF